MFHLAVISDAVNAVARENEYIKELEALQCSVFFIKLEELGSCEEKIDAVIINDYSYDDNFDRLCEMIIGVRKVTSKYIWVFSENCPKIKRLIHLELGADGTFCNQMNADEGALLITRMLKRERGARVPEYLKAEDKKRELTIELMPCNSSVKLANSGEIELTKMEYKVLEYLYLNRDTAVTHEELIEAVWNDKNLSKGYRVVNLIFHLRNKLESDEVFKKHVVIKTVRSKGYRLFAQ